jgi:hypothetical protein
MLRRRMCSRARLEAAVEGCASSIRPLLRHRNKGQVVRFVRISFARKLLMPLFRGVFLRRRTCKWRQRRSSCSPDFPIRRKVGFRT